MGCFHSRKECSDSHPNVFRVTNIDESGHELWGGQLELTDTDLILCRTGREDTVWPLPSLRRYGFDGDVFSFESGRRCPTGEGIYAFRCRRANLLFSQLQNNIQLRNVIHESMQFNTPSNIMAGSPSVIPRATLQASVVHRSSVDNGQPRNLLRNVNIPSHLSNTHNTTVPSNQSPRSLSNADILEVTPLYPRPHSNTTQVTNVYQVKEFKSKEHNNNQSEQSTEVAHIYTNDNDLNRSLAKLRSELKDSTARSNFKDMIEESAFLQTVSSNKSLTPTSPTTSTASEHDQVRLYQNIRPTDIAKQEFLRSFEVPSTPLGLKLPEYCNLNINNRPELNYANLNVGEMEDGVNNVKNNVFIRQKEAKHKLSESDTNASMSPIEEVNYAILDMEAKEAGKVGREVVSLESHSVSSSRHESTTSQCSVPQPSSVRHLSQSSLDNASAFNISAAPGSVGYTTIDFDKTVALTSVVSGADMEADGSRKTRHDSHCGSPVKAK